MKKKIVILLIFIGIICLSIGGYLFVQNSNENKFESVVIKGKLFAEQEEYDKAIDSFELALKINSEDKEVPIFLEQINNLVQANLLQEQGNIDGALSKLELVINEKDGLNSLINKADDQIENIQLEKEKMNEYAEQLAEIKKLNNDRDYITSLEMVTNLEEETRDQDKYKEYHAKASEILDSLNEMIKEQEEKVAKQKAEDEALAKEQEEIKSEEISEINSPFEKYDGNFVSKVTVASYMESEEYEYLEGDTTLTLNIDNNIATGEVRGPQIGYQFTTEVNEEGSIELFQAYWNGELIEGGGTLELYDSQIILHSYSGDGEWINTFDL